MQGAAGREWQVNPGIVDNARAHAREDAVAADESADQRRRIVVAGLERVGGEQPGVAGTEKGNAKLYAPALGSDLAQVGHRVACPGVVEGQGARESPAANRRIGVRRLEVIDVLAELPLKRKALGPTQQVGLLEPDEAAEAGSLSQGCPEIHVAGALLLHSEDDVDIPLLVGGPGIRRRHRVSEEA